MQLWYKLSSVTSSISRETTSNLFCILNLFKLPSIFYTIHCKSRISGKNGLCVVLVS